MLLLEGVGDVLEEDQAQDDVLVLGGVHRTAERVGHLPELGLVADRRAAVLLAFRSLRVLPAPRHCRRAPQSTR
jgi:hypothetical protein